MTNAMPANPFFIGVDLSSRHIRVGLMDENGVLLRFHREPLELSVNDDNQGRLLAEKLKVAIRQTIAEQPSRLAGMGVGFPGLVNAETNQIVRLPNAPSMAEINLYDELLHEFNVPTVFDNNTNATTIAEMRQGVAQGVEDFLLVRIGHGIGAGLVLDGKLRRGTSGFAGEIGHVNIDPEGLLCVCGSRGCLETVASAPSIVRRTRSRLHQDSTSSLSQFEKRDEDFTYDDIVKAALMGDELALLMMQRTGFFVGMVVADMINVLNLSMVVIAGNSDARPILVPAIVEEARRRSFAEAFADCEIVAGKLASDAGVIGAAILAQKLATKISNSNQS